MLPVGTNLRLKSVPKAVIGLIAKVTSHTYIFCRACGVYIPSPDKGRRAGFFKRAVAYTIDLLLPALFLFIIILSMSVFGNGTADLEDMAEFLLLEHQMEDASPTILAQSALTVLFLLEYAIWVVYEMRNGLTPGKRIMGLRVISWKNGGSPRLWRMLLRETFGRFMSFLFFGLGYIRAMFDKDGRTWHDIIAGTVVLEGAGAKSVPPVKMGKAARFFLISYSAIILGIAGYAAITGNFSDLVKGWSVYRIDDIGRMEVSIVTPTVKAVFADRKEMSKMVEGIHGAFDLDSDIVREALMETRFVVADKDYHWKWWWIGGLYEAEFEKITVEKVNGGGTIIHEMLHAVYTKIDEEAKGSFERRVNEIYWLMPEEVYWRIIRKVEKREKKDISEVVGLSPGEKRLFEDYRKVWEGIERQVDFMYGDDKEKKRLSPRSVNEVFAGLGADLPYMPLDFEGYYSGILRKDYLDGKKWVDVKREDMPVVQRIVEKIKEKISPGRGGGAGAWGRVDSEKGR